MSVQQRGQSSAAASSSFVFSMFLSVCVCVCVSVWGMGESGCTARGRDQMWLTAGLDWGGQVEQSFSTAQ